jgi:hypothetical protein
MRDLGLGHGNQKRLFLELFPPTFQSLSPARPQLWNSSRQLINFCTSRKSLFSECSRAPEASIQALRGMTGSYQISYKIETYYLGMSRKLLNILKAENFF